MILARRSFLIGATAFLAAPAIVRAASLMPVKALPPIVRQVWPWRVIALPPERMWTNYTLRTNCNGWWNTEMGVICHKPDLSDLGEPYLSAVRQTLLERKVARNVPPAVGI